MVDNETPQEKRDAELKQFNKKIAGDAWLTRQKRAIAADYAERTPMVIAQKYSSRTADLDRPNTTMAAMSANRQTRTARFGAVMSGSGWALTGLGTILLILLILGPGLTAVLNIFTAIAWYWWIALIAGGILIIRRK
jgi:hypothetical protein